MCRMHIECILCCVSSGPPPAVGSQAEKLDFRDRSSDRPSSSLIGQKIETVVLLAERQHIITIR